MSKTSSSSGGIGILGALGVLFVGLKLTGYIDWSWLWVTAPFWGLFALVVALVLFAAIAKLVAVLVTRKKKRRPVTVQRAGQAPVSPPHPPRGNVSSPRESARREPVVTSSVSRPLTSGRREAASSSTVSNPSRDDIYTNPLHPLNPTSHAIYAASDDTPTRSHCSSSHTSHGGYSDSSSYSSSSDSSCSSSSDSSSSSSSSD